MVARKSRQRQSRRRGNVVKRALRAWKRPRTIRGRVAKWALVNTGRATTRAFGWSARTARRGTVRVADKAAGRAERNGRDGTANAWQWLAAFVGQRPTYTCCGTRFIDDSAYRDHVRTHFVEVKAAQRRAKASGSKTSRSTQTQTQAPQAAVPAAVGRSTPKAAARAARYWQRRARMTDGARTYLDSFSGLLEGLKEFESHADFAARLDDLAAIERQRAEILAEFGMDLGRCIHLDARVVQALAGGAENGDILGGLEAAVKVFREVYGQIIEAEEGGVTPLQATA